MENPIFLLIPGAWHSPTVYGDVCKILSAQGYDHEYVILETIGADPPLKDFWPDVEGIRAALDDLLAEGRNIVIVMHSCGSVAVAEALQPYIDENGKFKAGKNGAKVIRLAYMASFPLGEGQCLLDDVGGQDLPWWHVVNDNMEVTDPKTVFYNDLSDEDAEKHVASMYSQSYCIVLSKVSFAPWKYIPSAYLFTENDNAFHLDRQKNLVNAARKVQPKSFSIVRSMNASHCPFLSRPAEVAEFLIDAAEGKESSLG